MHQMLIRHLLKHTNRSLDMHEMFNQLLACFYTNRKKCNQTCHSDHEVLTTRPEAEQRQSWHDTECRPTHARCLKLLTSYQQVLPSTPRSCDASLDCLQFNNTYTANSTILD